MSYKKIEKEFGPGFANMLLLLTGRPLPLNFEVKESRPLRYFMQLLMERFQTRMDFVARTVPKKVKSMRHNLEIDYDRALNVKFYLSSREYADRTYRYHFKHDELMSTLTKASAKENWPVNDQNVNVSEGQFEESDLRLYFRRCTDSSSE